MEGSFVGMNIYFAGSIKGGRQDQELYLRIISLLGNYGNVLTEHVGNAKLDMVGLTITDEAIFQKDIAWLKEADLIVAEVTTPSLGVGYEIGIAEAAGKPVLCLYRKGERRLSAMLAGNPALHVREYIDVENLKDVQEIFNSFITEKLPEYNMKAHGKTI